MMQKNSMVETQSLNQRNKTQSLNQRNKKDMQRKKTTITKKTPKKQGEDNGMQLQTPNTPQPKKKTRNVTILFQPQTLHNNRTITCNNEKRNQQNNHKHNNSTITSI